MRTFCFFLFSALSISGCATTSSLTADSLESDEASAWNADFADTADVHHSLRIDRRPNSLSFAASGRERHRVSFEVIGSAQRVTVDVQGDPMAVAFHGADVGDAPWVEMRIAEELEAAQHVDVVLQPGAYTFDFWQPTSAWDTPHAVSIDIAAEIVIPRANETGVQRLSTGDEIRGSLRFGERRSFVVAGPGLLGLTPLTDEAVLGCTEARVTGGGEDPKSFSSEHVNFNMTVWEDQELSVDIIGCRPGVWNFDHAVRDLD